MAKLNYKKNGIVKLKVVAEMLHKSLSLKKKWKHKEARHGSNNVPDDVKEGHFAVVAEHGEEPRRFVVPLSYLTHPRFLMLLEQAAEEYGFDNKGALTVPCCPSELERILADEQQQQQGQEREDPNANVTWATSYEAMIQSY
ncbi:protein SMALL AUXIN UP-REGULATED RNA 16-like [Gossypium arboreum]|uniref:Uncharacterized protein n=1 Tax=Gossypium arboreum TaxID=29729 RepID=A0ABR0MJR8_GOSAR|nr:protein SMALL AUXIN UP-REGULATED RNA 16-like [Gossypium arboreum]KAK5773502.1 hypothetical protein PVK06_049808 [Gossypium arboreum]